MKTIALFHPHGGMGDLILSFPVIDAFAGAYPDSKIIYAVGARMEEIVSLHPRVHETVCLSPGFSAARALAGKLRSRSVEIGCALWSTARIAWLMKLAGIPVRVGQGGRFPQSMLFTHRVDVRSANGDTKSHWVECLLDYPRALGIDPRKKEISISIPDSAVQNGRSLLSNLGISFSKPVAVIHPGKGENVLKRGWPVRLFADVADQLIESGREVVFTGSQSEVPLVETISTRMKNRAASTAGRTDFLTLSGALSHAGVMICPDSGPMHLAAALGIPVVALFAMEKDFPSRWAPWNVPHEIIRPEKFPCKASCAKETCADFKCFQALSSGRIVESALRLSE